MKLPYYFCFLSILLLFSVQSKGQILLEGNIEADSIMEASVHVVNLTQKTGTINKDDGSFEIKVNKGDTLFFSSVQYEILEAVITDEIYRKKKLTIKLKPKVNQLEEVVISNIKLSGDLESDVAAIEVKPFFDFGLPQRKGPKPTPADRYLYTATSSNIDLLVNIITGRLKMLEQHKENMDNVVLVQKAMELFPKAYFTETLGVEEHQIENFLHFCLRTAPEFENLVQQDEILKLIVLFTESLAKFELERAGETN